MKKIEMMNSLFREIFKTSHNFILFPFAILGLIFAMAFYMFCPFYMLAELFVDELKAILCENRENDSNGTQVVKHLIGFGAVVIFNYLRALMVIPLAIGYFMTSISFTVSSLGKFKNNPFAYSK